MLNKWMFDKKKLRQTPSQSDGVDYLTEILYRKEGLLILLYVTSRFKTTRPGCVHWQLFKVCFYHKNRNVHFFHYSNISSLILSGAKFIQAAVKELRLTHDTMATGCVFFHRFFMFHSFEKFNRYVCRVMIRCNLKGFKSWIEQLFCLETVLFIA